jgi:hypothetical protein
MGRHAQRRRKTHHTTQRPAQDTPRTIPPELAQECLVVFGRSIHTNGGMVS